MIRCSSIPSVYNLGGKHEEAKQNRSVEGGFEEKKCQKLPEKIERGKKVSFLMKCGEC